MKYEFELVLSREPQDGELDALFEVGCDDMTFGTDGTTATAMVHRRASSFVEATTSAITQIESAVPGLCVRAVRADQQLTIGEIAERVGVTRETVRRHVNDRDFPRPVITTPRHRFWRWSDVAPQFGVKDRMLEEAAPAARALNAWLDLRAVVPVVAPKLEDVAAALLAA